MNRLRIVGKNDDGSAVVALRSEPFSRATVGLVKATIYAVTIALIGWGLLVVGSSLIPA